MGVRILPVPQDRCPRDSGRTSRETRPPANARQTVAAMTATGAAPRAYAARCQAPDPKPQGGPPAPRAPTHPRSPRAPGRARARARAPRRRGAPWDKPPPSSGPRSLTGEGEAAPPLGDPASPASTSPGRPAGNLGPSGASRAATPTPGRRRGVPLRAAYAASGWRVASSRPVRLAGSCNFPSAPRSVPRLPRGRRETPGATNRRASSGPVRP